MLYPGRALAGAGLMQELGAGPNARPRREKFGKSIVGVRL